VLLTIAALQATGCQALLRNVGPADREYDAAPFSKEAATQGDSKGDQDEAPGDEDDGDDEPAHWPNIEDPGPDMANFPNSAFTIPRGAVHVEVAPVSLSGPTDDNSPVYSTQFLLRYGVTERLEFRIFGLGYTSVFNGSQNTTGFAPPAFDFKMNLWDESKNHLIPAVGLEVYLQTEFGSPAFRSGLQPAMTLLFDHSLPFDFEFEWNVGVNGAEAPLFSGNEANGPINLVHGPERNVLEWNLQWALQRRVFRKLDVFTHGFLNSSAIPTIGDGVTVGAGGIWTASERLALFGSYNAGLNRDAPTTFFQLGFAWAL
jgi:hypothetical protein